MRYWGRSFRTDGGVWINNWRYLFTAEPAENAESHGNHSPPGKAILQNIVNGCQAIEGYLYSRKYKYTLEGR